MRRRKTMAAAVGLALLAGIGLTACGSGEATETEPPAAIQTEQTQSPESMDDGGYVEESDWEAAQRATAPTPEVVAFGDTTTWPDGLEMTVSEPTPYTPQGETSVSANGFKDFVLVTLTVNNTGTRPYSFVDFSTSVSSAAQEGEVVGDDVYDWAGPSTDVLPGKSVTFKHILNVADASDVTLEVHRDFDGLPAYFVTTGVPEAS